MQNGVTCTLCKLVGRVSVEWVFVVAVCVRVAVQLYVSCMCLWETAEPVFLFPTTKDKYLSAPN